MSAAPHALLAQMYELDVPLLSAHFASGNDVNAPLEHGRTLLHHVAAERPTNANTAPIRMRAAGARPSVLP